ncbi:MAG: GNAT family N-acetyltransferase [Actinomycetes bacterium]
MSDDQLVIRDAVASDADAMGRLHVRAWQHAYRGVMPDVYLDGLRAEDRIEMWRADLERPDAPPILVAEVAGEVVGFAVVDAAAPPVVSGDGSSGPWPEVPSACGELYAMNLDTGHWGRGFGRALLRRATASLSALGYDEAVLWVVPENVRARSLYESEGWAADGAARTDEVLGVTVTDVRYRRVLTDVPPPS